MGPSHVYTHTHTRGLEPSLGIQKELATICQLPFGLHISPKAKWSMLPQFVLLASPSSSQDPQCEMQRGRESHCFLSVVLCCQAAQGPVSLDLTPPPLPDVPLLDPQHRKWQIQILMIDGQTQMLQDFGNTVL